MAFSPPEYRRLFAQKKAYQGEVTGTPGPPLATPLLDLQISSLVGYFTKKNAFIVYLICFNETVYDKWGLR